MPRRINTSWGWLEKVDEAEKLVQVASYASCRDLVIPLTLLKEIIGQIARLEQLYDEAALAEAAVAECEPPERRTQLHLSQSTFGGESRPRQHA